MFSKFSEEAQRVLLNAKEEMINFSHPFVGSEHLFLSILKNANNEIIDIFRDLGVTYDSFHKKLVEVVGFGDSDNSLFLYTPLLKRILESSCSLAREVSTREVGVIHLILAILEEGDGVALRLLDDMDVDLDEMYDLFSERSVPFKTNNTHKLLIEDFGVDLTKKASEGGIDPVIGRDEEITRILEILSRRSKNNPLLVGDAGVGKTAIVEELARRIVCDEVPSSLKNKKIISVEIASLVAGTKYRGEFEERVSKILKEVELRDDVIIFVDEVHTLVGAGGAEGAIDASNILKPALSRGKLKLIGATTIDEYKKTIEKDKAFDRRFQKVEIKEPDEEKTYQILLGIKDLYTSFHGVVLDSNLLKDIIELTNNYMYDRYQPDKSIDILDEVCSMVELEKSSSSSEISGLKKQIETLKNKKNMCIVRHRFQEAAKVFEEEKQVSSLLNELELKEMENCQIKEVTKEDIRKVIFNKTKIPIYDMNNQTLETLSKLEDDLNTLVVGQKDAVSNLCNYTKRVKFGLKKGKRPASFLFVGPTGVGKTHLVKEYAKRIGNDSSFIRLDMSEYMEDFSSSKIIGSPSGYVGYEDGKNILEQVRLHPYSVILLDEIEKASPKVMNLFLQVLDEGFMRDASGREVRFDHTTIIMTSNIGFSHESIGFCKDEGSVLSKLKEFLSIEFINRIDEIIIFHRLEFDNIMNIVSQKLDNIKSHFKERGIKLTISKNVLKEVIELSNYLEFGARKIDKILEEKIDRLVIDQIILGNKSVSIKTIDSVKS